jgi:gliding motility-associated-like protein
MKRSLVAGLAWALSAFLWATHYLGGDLTYQCLGPGPGNTTRYRLRFTLYRDCKGIPAPNSVTVNYSSTQCGVNNRSVTLSPIGGTGTDITPQIACSGYISSCPNGGNPNYGIQRWIYEATVSLPAGCGSDWVFYTTDCCRSNDIDNISNPGGTGSAFYARLDNTVTPCNSSPQFTNLPQMFNCVNQPTLLNLGVVDPDGDSLVIELTNCRSDGVGAPNTSVTYNAPYSGTSPFPTLSGILIQSNGLFSYIAAQAIRSVFCYRVREFRNGVQIGETFQDVYLIIQNCPNPTPPAATAGTTVQPNPVQYNETNPNTFTFQAPVCPLGGGQQFCINLQYRDTVNPSPANQLQVNVVQVPPGATATVTGNGTNTAQVQICWTPTLANVGQNYNVVVSVSNNTCPIRGRWDYTYIVRVRAGIQKENYIAVVRGPGDTVVTRDTLVCRGTRLRLYLTARDSVPPSDIASVIWTATGGATPPPSFPPNPLSQAISPTITVTQSASYIATIMYRGGCMDRDTIRIRMQTPDTLRISPNPASVCIGDTLTLTATSALNLPISWYIGAPLTGTPLGSGSSVTFSPNAPPRQEKIYVVSQDTLGCTYIDSALVDVEAGPSFSATSTPATCRGQNNGAITLTPAAGGSYNYFLYNAGGGVIAGPVPNGQFSNLAPGTYIVAVQGPLPSPCQSFDTVFVGQGDSVRVSILGDSIRYVCPLIPVTFEAVGSTTLNASLTYLWNFGNGNTQTTTTTSVTQSYPTPGIYTVVVQAVTPQGCFATDTVIVNTLNSLGLTAQASPVCKGATTGTVTLTVGGNPQPPVSYSAFPVVPGAGPTFGPQSTATFTGLPVGVLYEFIAQDNAGCQGRDTIALRVTDSVEIVSLNHGPIPTCYPAAVSLTAQVQGTGSFVYYWDFGNGGRDTTQVPTTTALYSAGGNYIVTLIVENTAGCRDTALLPLFVPATGERIDAEIVSAGPVLQGCVPLTVNFEGTGTSSIGSPLTFSWDFRDGNTASGTQVTHTFTQPGYYNVIFYAQSSPQCYDTAQVLVWVDGQPQAQIIVPPQPSSLGYYVASPITFTAAPGPYNVRFFWRADSQAAATGSSYTISYLQKGTFCVYLTVESELGCVDTAEYCFDVSGYVLLIPNAFTPNGDGINDVFKVVGYGMEYIELTVYDRWGTQVYAARGTEQVIWDGTKGGTPLPEGAYVYLVRYKLIDKEGVEYRTGTVTLLR